MPESPAGSADADAVAGAEVCVAVEDAPAPAAVPCPPVCGSVDEIATEPAVVALPWWAVERLLSAREPMTAIPAKPPVVVTLRASDRRRWEWRLRWLRKPPAEPSSGTNSGAAGGAAAAVAVRAVAAVRAVTTVRAVAAAL